MVAVDEDHVVGHGLSGRDDAVDLVLGGVGLAVGPDQLVIRDEFRAASPQQGEGRRDVQVLEFCRPRQLRVDALLADPARGELGQQFLLVSAAEESQPGPDQACQRQQEEYGAADHRARERFARIQGAEICRIRDLRGSPAAVLHPFIEELLLVPFHAAQAALDGDGAAAEALCLVVQVVPVLLHDRLGGSLVRAFQVQSHPLLVLGPVYDEVFPVIVLRERVEDHVAVGQRIIIPRLQLCPCVLGHLPEFTAAYRQRGSQKHGSEHRKRKRDQKERQIRSARPGLQFPIQLSHNKPLFF